jgi:hypothetical protein
MKKAFLIATVLFFSATAFTACNSDEIKGNRQMETPAGGEMFTCPIHNEVMSGKPGKCPKGEMDMVKQKMTTGQKKMMDEGTYTKPKE